MRDNDSRLLEEAYGAMKWPNTLTSGMKISYIPKDMPTGLKRNGLITDVYKVDQGYNTVVVIDNKEKFVVNSKAAELKSLNDGREYNISFVSKHT